MWFSSICCRFLSLSILSWSKTSCNFIHRFNSSKIFNRIRIWNWNQINAHVLWIIVSGILLAWSFVNLRCKHCNVHKIYANWISIERTLFLYNILEREREHFGKHLWWYLLWMPLNCMQITITISSENGSYLARRCLFLNFPVYPSSHNSRTSSRSAGR